MGVLFSRGNVDELREKLKMLIDDPVIVKKYKQSSSSYICSKYNWDKVVDETMELYQK